MKRLLNIIRNYWLTILIASIYVTAFGSFIIEPYAINIMLVILLSGIACIYIIKTKHPKGVGNNKLKI